MFFFFYIDGLFGGLSHSFYIEVTTSNYPFKMFVYYTLQIISLYLTSLSTLTVSVNAKKEIKICNSLTNSNKKFISSVKFYKKLLLLNTFHSLHVYVYQQYFYSPCTSVYHLRISLQAV